MSTPHDALFKAVFSDPEHASGALAAVMPPSLAAAIHWPSLAHSPGSFVDPELRSQHTDLLFSTTWRDGSDALLYLLFEHQSSPEPDMGLRLLRYQLRIWERWRAEHADRSRLPAVIPVVLYHGATAWSVPRSFAAALDVSPEMLAIVGPYVVQFDYLLDDLSHVPDEVLRRRVMTALARLTEVCFKHARDHADPVAMIRAHLDVVCEVAAATHGIEALALVLRYIFEVTQVDREAMRSVIELAIGPEVGGAMMTTADELRLEGRLEGRQEGLVQGERKVLLRQLRKRFGDAVNANVEQRLEAAPIEQLETWVDRVLSAASLDELLAD